MFQRRPTPSTVTNYEGTKFDGGEEGGLGIGLYRNSEVCYGEGATSRSHYQAGAEIPHHRSKEAEKNLLNWLSIPNKDIE